jgi:hypothetical protein
VVGSTRAGGPIAKTFAINACFDGNAVTLRNDLHFPVTVSARGSAGALRVVQFNQAAASVLVRGLDHSPGLMLPGDLVRVVISKGFRGRADLGRADAHDEALRDCGRCRALHPGQGGGQYNAFSGMVVEVGTAVDHFPSSISAPSS